MLNEREETQECIVSMIHLCRFIYTQVKLICASTSQVAIWKVRV